MLSREDVAQRILALPAAERGRAADLALRVYGRAPVALNPIELARRVGIEPDPWQAEILTATAPETVVCTSRQVGKSTTTAVLGLYEALFRPPALVLLLAGVFRQSGELYGKLVETYRKLEGTPGIAAVSERSATRMVFANGSRVVCLPGNPSGVRGYSAPRLVIVDEAAYAPDALFDAVRPMLATSSDGRLCLISTPNGKQGAFWEAWEDQTPGVLKVRVRADECPRISAEFLERERRKGERYFAREFGAEFVEGVDSVFRYEDIQAAMSDDVEPLFSDWG